MPYNPDLAGTITTWIDPADGHEYVINGHNRFAKAEAAGIETQNVRRINAPDAAAARYTGALINIAEGQGTALDAAKIFREKGTNADDLASSGVALKGKIAGDGLAISNLDDFLYRQVQNGSIPESHGVAIGKTGLDPTGQQALYSIVDRAQRSGKTVSPADIEQLAHDVKNAPTATMNADNLFGDEGTTQQNLALEKAQLAAHVKSQLAADQKLFGGLTKETKASALERGNNKIDVQENARLATEAAQSVDAFDRARRLNDPRIDAALNEAALAEAGGAKSHVVRTQLVERIKSALATPDSTGEAGRAPGTVEPSAAAEPTGAGLFDAGTVDSGAAETKPVEAAAHEVNPETRGALAKAAQTRQDLEAQGWTLEGEHPTGAQLFRKGDLSVFRDSNGNQKTTSPAAARKLFNASGRAEPSPPSSSSSVSLRVTEAEQLQAKIGYEHPLSKRLDDAAGNATGAKISVDVTPEEQSLLRKAASQLTPGDLEGTDVKLPALKKRLGAEPSAQIAPKQTGRNTGAVNPLGPGAPGSPSAKVSDALGKFLERDVKPGVDKVSAGLRRMKDFLKTALDAPHSSPDAWDTAQNARQLNAERVRTEQRQYDAFMKVAEVYDQLTPADQTEYFHKAEHGNLDLNDPLEKAVHIAQQAVNEVWKDVTGKDASSAEGIENFFARYWKDPKKAGQVLGAQSNRSLTGSKGFLKERSFTYTSDGLAAGLELRDTNPLRNQYAKIQEMTRYKMGRDLWESEKAAGRLQFNAFGKSLPDGFARVNAETARVYERRATIKADGTEGSGEFVARGEWIAPDGSARIINRFLSPGLHGNPAFDAAAFASNSLRQVKFGLSGFHAVFTGINAVAVRNGLAIEQGARGSIGTAAKTAAASLKAPVDYYKAGREMTKEYLNPGSTNKALEVDYLQRAGGRARQGAEYSNQAVASMKRAFAAVRSELNEGNPLGAGAKVAKGVSLIPFATIEKALAPIMEKQVPYIKQGAFSELAADRLAQLPKDAGLVEQNKVLSETWDQVENVFGQMTLDNLFWNRAVKDAVQISTQLGWNYGSLRKGVGTIAETVGAPKRAFTKSGPVITGNMAYMGGLTVTTMLFGSMLGYLHGEPPKTPYDMIAPKTGRDMNGGEPERLALPTYFKDYTSWLTQPPGKTIKGKESTALAMLFQIFSNRDYYDKPILDMTHGPKAAAGRIGGYLLDQTQPISVGAMLQSKKEGESAGQMLERAAGIQPEHRSSKRH